MATPEGIRCRKCGALNAQGAEWCTQCYTPLSHRFYRPGMPEPAPYGPRDRDTGRKTTRRHLGLGGKIAITAVFVALAAAVTPIVIELAREGSFGTQAFAFVYGMIILAVGLLLLYRIWWPDRG